LTLWLLAISGILFAINFKFAIYLLSYLALLYLVKKWGIFFLKKKRQWNQWLKQATIENQWLKTTMKSILFLKKRPWKWLANLPHLCKSVWMYVGLQALGIDSMYVGNSIWNKWNQWLKFIFIFCMFIDSEKRREFMMILLRIYVREMWVLSEAYAIPVVGYKKKTLTCS